ncbi:hypothetical protein N9R54_01730 [Pelobium sp.]|nr:hypothetical protein [Pelobium sp.]MDA9554930.1 hypothetical protein [Pelobium sp.]
MKNFVFGLSVLLVVHLGLNGQEIIKIQPINSTSTALKYPEAKSAVSKKDSSVTIRICTPSRSAQLAQNKPLFVFNYGEKQLKTTVQLYNNLDMNWISNINVLKDVSSISMYGPEGNNGVIIINIKPKFEKDFKKMMKAQKLI